MRYGGRPTLILAVELLGAAIATAMVAWLVALCFGPRSPVGPRPLFAEWVRDERGWGYSQIYHRTDASGSVLFADPHLNLAVLVVCDTSNTALACASAHCDGESAVFLSNQPGEFRVQVARNKLVLAKPALEGPTVQGEFALGDGAAAALLHSWDVSKKDDLVLEVLCRTYP